jgi:hypothetical protein
MSLARIVLISRPNPIPFQPRALEGFIATKGRASVGKSLKPRGTHAREPFGAANGIGSASPLSPNAHRDAQGEDPLPVLVGSRLSGKELAKSGWERKPTSCSPLKTQRFEYQIDVPIQLRLVRTMTMFQYPALFTPPTVVHNTDRPVNYRLFLTIRLVG